MSLAFLNGYGSLLTNHFLRGRCPKRKGGKMKRGMWLSIVFTLMVCCFFSSNVFALKKLHDNFSGTYLDGQRWKYHDFFERLRRESLY